MENAKLKIKIGDHEFEAEGPTELVQAQFTTFRDLVLNIPASKQVQPTTIVSEVALPAASADNGAPVCDKIMRQDGRIVSLTARGASIEDEIMLVLLGQKMLRNNESVTGAEITSGLKVTGGAIGRIDFKLDKLSKEGNVITIGTHRARRYRLTNRGAAKAHEIAKAVISTVA